MKLDGLSRQIALTMAAMALGMTILVVASAYTFYNVLIKYWPGETNLTGWTPTGPEWVWLIATTLAGLALAIVVGVNLSRRILAPLNSVADGIRRVAHGDLGARARWPATAHCAKPRCSPTISTRSPTNCSA